MVSSHQNHEVQCALTNTHLPASIHPHGVSYGKTPKAPYADGTSGANKADDEVAPGQTHTYVWKVPEWAGPGPMDQSSIMWMYWSCPGLTDIQDEADRLGEDVRMDDDVGRARRQRPYFSPAFKAQTVELICETGKTIPRGLPRPGPVGNRCAALGDPGRHRRWPRRRAEH